jgi:hypothetical protein
LGLELEDKSPLTDLTGEYSECNQTQPDVWFLAGTSGGKAERSCSLPSKSIFFPIINNLISYQEYPWLNNDEALIAYARRDLDETQMAELNLNGTELTTIDSNRITTEIFEIQFPVDITNRKTANTRAVSDGYWAFLTPLSKGEHTIYFRGRKLAYDQLLKGSSRDLDKPKFEVQVTYYLMVK